MSVIHKENQITPYENEDAIYSKIGNVKKGHFKFRNPFVDNKTKYNDGKKKYLNKNLNQNVYFVPLTSTQNKFKNYCLANIYEKKTVIDGEELIYYVSRVSMNDFLEKANIKRFSKIEEKEKLILSMMNLGLIKDIENEDVIDKEQIRLFDGHKYVIDKKTGKAYIEYTVSQFFKQFLITNNDDKKNNYSQVDIYSTLPDELSILADFEMYLQSIARLNKPPINFIELKAIFQCDDVYFGDYAIYNFVKRRLDPTIEKLSKNYKITYSITGDKKNQYQTFFKFTVEDKRYIEAKSKKLLNVIENSGKVEPYKSVYISEIVDYDKFVNVCLQKISKQFVQFDNDSVIAYFNDFIKNVDESILKIQGEHNNAWTPKTNYTAYFFGALDKKLEQSDTDGSTLDVEFYTSTVEKESYLAFAESMSYSSFSENAKSFIVKSFKKLGDVNSSLFADLFETYFLIICCYDVKGNNNAYIIAASDDLKILANTTFKSKIYHFLNSFDFLRFDAQDVMTFTDFLVKVQSDEIRLTKNEGETSE